MDTPEIAHASFWHKKTLGITNIYLYGGAAVILGVVAWRMKSTVAKPSPSADTTASADSSLPSSGDPYSGLGATSTGLAGTPTDTTVTTPTDNSLPNASIPNNQVWVSKGVQYLVSNNQATGTDAQAALNAYTSGANYSFDQSVLINKVFKELGPPPDSLPTLGSASPAPAQRQFTEFPGVHTVKGNNDNTFALLSQLYYNRYGDDTTHLLQAHNLTIANLSSFSVGTRVNIPVWSLPKYFTATANTRTAAAIAAANGITTDELQYLNDGGSTPKLTFPVAVNTRVRVG